MGQKKKYSNERLHAPRHMGEYLREVTAGSVSPYRVQVLKERFADVKKMAFEMYQDAYLLIQKLDGEQPNDIRMLWQHQLKLNEISGKSGDYSKKNLHAMRHLEEYISEIEAGNIDAVRVTVLKQRLAVVLDLSVKLYYDSERLLKKLD